MPLYWVVRRHEGRDTVFLQEANAEIYGWLKSALAGHTGERVEILTLDPASARRIPRAMRGRVLTKADLATLRKLAKRKKASPRHKARARQV